MRLGATSVYNMAIRQQRSQKSVSKWVILPTQCDGERAVDGLNASVITESALSEARTYQPTRLNAPKRLILYFVGPALVRRHETRLVNNSTGGGTNHHHCNDKQ